MDFEVESRHNLDRLVVMNPDATMNGKLGKYCGRYCEKYCKKLLKFLKEQEPNLFFFRH